MRKSSGCKLQWVWRRIGSQQDIIAGARPHLNEYNELWSKRCFERKLYWHQIWKSTGFCTKESPLTTLVWVALLMTSILLQVSILGVGFSWQPACWGAFLMTISELDGASHDKQHQGRGFSWWPALWAQPFAASKIFGRASRDCCDVARIYILVLSNSL